MRIYYRERGSPYGYSAGLGEYAFFWLLVWIGFLPFYAAYLLIVWTLWALIAVLYLLTIVVALIYKRLTGHPPTWKIHTKPMLLDHWLHRNNIVKIPPGKPRIYLD